MATDDDVSHLEYIDGILEHREKIHVRVCDDVCNVTVHKDLAWIQVDDLVGRHARVRASDPQNLGLLLLFQLGKESGALLFSLDGPGLVLAEQLIRETPGLSRDGWEVARVKISIITGMAASFFLVCLEVANTVVDDRISCVRSSKGGALVASIAGGSSSDGLIDALATIAIAIVRRVSS